MISLDEKKQTFISELGDWLGRALFTYEVEAADDFDYPDDYTAREIQVDQDAVELAAQIVQNGNHVLRLAVDYIEALEDELYGSADIS